jgi:hypothetical protein
VIRLFGKEVNVSLHTCNRCQRRWHTLQQ